MMSRWLFIFVLPVVFPMTGCIQVGPDYQRPEMDSHATWAASKKASFNQALPEDIETWWQELQDPMLNSLVDRAFNANLDLAIAVQRVRQAAANRGIAAGERFPDLDGSGSYSRERQGANNFPALTDPQEFNSYALGFDLAWELDVWGRVSRLIESADADLEASIEGLHDVRLILAAEVATEYVQLRTAQARLEVAERNIEIQKRSFEITKARFDAGAAPQLDVSQAETNLANTEAEVPSLKSDVRNSLLRLAVLLGENPTALIEELSTPVAVPTSPEEIGVGIPADILRRRPDIRLAERTLAAEVARIGVEVAEFYPRFTLGGTFQYSATNSGVLFDSDSSGFGFGPSFSWNLFDGGRVRNAVRAQEAIADQALLEYRSTVLTAFEEVESAMYTHARELERAEALSRASNAAQQSADLSRQLYLEGRSDFQSVLDSERELFSAEDNLILSRSQAVTTYITLQRSLGGGWSPYLDEGEEEDGSEE
ncbi:MAG: efflux transporter outer membrane subunit [Planctomycetota bacterium]